MPAQDHLLSPLEKTRDILSGDILSSGESSTEGGDVGQKQAPRRRIGTLKELLEGFPELRDVCADGTQQQVPKPKNKRQSRQSYSGKSQCHTFKTQVTTAKRLILHVMGNLPGAVSDRFVLKASGVVTALERAASPMPPPR